MRALNFFLPLIVTLLTVSGCGTKIGNPEMDSPTAALGDKKDLDFGKPIEQYEANLTASDCGSFTEESSLGDVVAGRQCIRDAFEACAEAKYLLDQTLEDKSRLVSYVAVERTDSLTDPCQLRVHTVSNDSDQFVGDSEETCQELEATEPIELACGVAE